MVAAPLQISRGAGWMRITLDRPDEANAMSLALARAFRDAVTAADEDEDCHIVILAANGRFFCSGGDVVEMSEASDPSDFTRELAETMHEALLRLARSRLVVIAAVQGTVAGAGLGLVLAADLVLVAPKVVFVGAYGAVGLTPDCGVSYLLPRAIGRARASSVLLAGQVFDARQAVDWGLANEEVESSAMSARAEELAAGLAAGATQSLGPTRRLINRQAVDEYAAQLAEEAHSIARLAAIPDTKLRIAAFAARSSSRG